MHAETTRLPRTAFFLRRRTPVALGLLFLAAACGSGASTASTPAATGQLVVLSKDAALNGLAAFEAVIESAVLLDTNGAPTTELLQGPTAFALTGNEAQLEWLANANVPPGTYGGLRVQFSASSLTGTAPDGSSVAVVAGNNIWTTPFATPLIVAGSSYALITTALDPSDSLSGDVAAPPLTFAPQGTSSWDDGTSSNAIDEIKGTVTGVSPTASTFAIDAFSDDDLGTSLGPVTVSVTAGTLLLDDDGLAFPSASAFLGSLTPGLTLVEVHGLLQAGGLVAATKVEVEDSLSGGFQDEVEILGSVLSHDPGSQLFQLLVQFVEKGGDKLPPTLGTPAVLPVSYNASTMFFLDSVAPTTAASLAVGQLVEVDFEPFQGPPYLAKKVEIEDGDGLAEYEGWITNTAGLPGSMTINLESGSPAIWAGTVDSSQTNVTVSLAGTQLFLDTDSKPTLSTTQLLVGLKVEVKGLLSGPSSSPAIGANSVKVRAGRLDDADVTANSSAQGWFDTVGGKLKDPFGQGVGSGPLHVIVDPAAVFDGDASSATAFFAALASSSAEVEVFGIGTGVTNEIRAYEIDLDTD